MTDLHKFMENPLDDPNISIASLMGFTSDHLQRMINNMNSTVAARIGPTTTAFNLVGSTFTDDETKLGLRKARKLVKNHYRDGLPPMVGKIAVAVEAKFGEGSPEFVECFPHGRTIFSSCSDDQLANELQTLINGVTAHQTILTAQVVTDATAILTGWNGVFGASESSTGAKVATQVAKKNARAALQLELFKTLLTLALTYPRQPEQLDLYMQLSLLEPHTQAKTTPPPTTPKTPA